MRQITVEEPEPRGEEPPVFLKALTKYVASCKSQEEVDEVQRFVGKVCWLKRKVLSHEIAPIDKGDVVSFEADGKKRMGTVAFLEYSWHTDVNVVVKVGRQYYDTRPQELAILKQAKANHLFLHSKNAWSCAHCGHLNWLFGEKGKPTNRKKCGKCGKPRREYPMPKRLR